MKKGVVIESVYLNLNSGQPNQDSNVRREDIEAMLPAAINYVQVAESRMRKKEGFAEWYSNYTGVDSEFLATFFTELLFDDKREKYYIVPPVRIVSLVMDRGIDTVMAIQGDIPFIRLTDQFEDVTIAHILKDQVRFWYEPNYNGEQRIYFKNISPVVKELILKAIVSSDDLSDEEELPIPAGSEMQVMNMLLEWFSRGKQYIEDMRNNNTDGSTVQNIQKNPIKP